MPHLDRQLTPLVYLCRRPGGLADDEALDRHRVLGQLDERDLEVQPAHHPGEHVVEQPPDLWHRDPPLIVGMAVQPEVQRPEAAQHFGPRVTGGEVGPRRSKPPPVRKGIRCNEQVTVLDVYGSLLYAGSRTVQPASPAPADPPRRR